MFIRLAQTQFSECCPGSAAVVFDSKENKNYCSKCWGEKLYSEHPDYVKKNGEKSLK